MSYHHTPHSAFVGLERITHLRLFRRAEGGVPRRCSAGVQRECECLLPLNVECRSMPANIVNIQRIFLVPALPRGVLPRGDPSTRHGHQEPPTSGSELPNNGDSSSCEQRMLRLHPPLFPVLPPSHPRKKVKTPAVAHDGRGQDHAPDQGQPPKRTGRYLDILPAVRLTAPTTPPHPRPLPEPPQWRH